MRLLTVILSVFLLTGCIKTVYVPVSSCPKPPVIKEATLKTDMTPLNASTKAKLKDIVWDMIYLKQLKEQYKTILEGYNTPVVEIKSAQ